MGDGAMSEGASLKERIRRGDIVIGVSAPFDANKSQLEEILSKDSYDFLSVDSQHSPYNEERVVGDLRAGGRAGRPGPVSDKAHAARLLDRQYPGPGAARHRDSDRGGGGNRG